MYIRDRRDGIDGMWMGWEAGMVCTPYITGSASGCGGCHYFLGLCIVHCAELMERDGGIGIY